MQDFGRFKISFQTPLLRDYVVPGKYIELLDSRGFLLKKHVARFFGGIFRFGGSVFGSIPSGCSDFVSYGAVSPLFQNLKKAPCINQ